LIVHNRYRSQSPSGENRVVDQEYDALGRAGHTVERLERFSDDVAGFSWAQKAALPAEALWSTRAARSLSHTLEAFDPDVVHVHNLFPLLSPSVMYSCRRHRIPVVATIHNYHLICTSGVLFRSGAVCHECVGKHPLPAVRHRCYQGSAPSSALRAATSMVHHHAWRTMPSAYIFLSEAQRSEFASLDLTADRCFVKGNLVPPAPPRADTENLVVFLGRMNDEKGLPLLMEAWDLFDGDRRHPRLRLALAGAGPLESAVRAWARQRPSVEFVGLQSPAQCASLLARARAAVVPSQWREPFGLVAAEAMAAGVAPIAPAHGSFPELITDGVDGVLYPSGDAAELAKAFSSAADRPDWFDALGGNARRTYDRRFEPRANIRQLEAIYRFAIGSPTWLGSSPAGATGRSGGGTDVAAIPLREAPR
jgi:glycosyltransferase involved in cell wall biosynthesis